MCRSAAVPWADAACRLHAPGLDSFYFKRPALRTRSTRRWRSNNSTDCAGIFSTCLVLEFLRISAESDRFVAEAHAVVAELPTTTAVAALWKPRSLPVFSDTKPSLVQMVAELQDEADDPAQV